MKDGIGKKYTRDDKHLLTNSLQAMLKSDIRSLAAVIGEDD